MHTHTHTHTHTQTYRGLHSHDLSTSQRSCLLIPSSLWVKISKSEFVEDTNIQTIAIDWVSLSCNNKQPSKIQWLIAMQLYVPSLHGYVWLCVTILKGEKLASECKRKHSFGHWESLAKGKKNAELTNARSHTTDLHSGIIPLGFPGGSEDKVSACSAGDPGSIPGLGRSPGEGNGNPL